MVIGKKKPLPSGFPANRSAPLVQARVSSISGQTWSKASQILVVSRGTHLFGFANTAFGQNAPRYFAEYPESRA